MDVRTVREDDDRRLHLVLEGVEPAAQGRTRAALPLQALHRPGLGLHLIGADHDKDIVDRTRSHAVEHGREEELLLGRAESRCGARREDDGRNCQELSTDILSTMTVRVGCWFASPSFPIRSTTSLPSVTFPSTA